MYVCIMYMYICVYVFIMYICMYVCIMYRYIRMCGPGSSVNIATDYVLDGPGIETRWG
jgi:hypothetical protein